MTGLHSCKPGNEPVVGQVKTFIAEQRVGKSGKAYTKIKGASVENGGQPYKIVSVDPTGFTDSYGNISFNLEIEPANMVASDQVDPGFDPRHRGNLSASGQVMTKDDYWRRKEERDLENKPRIERQHSQEMAIRYCVMMGGLPKGQEEHSDTDKLRMMIDWFQRDISRQPYSAVEQQAKTMFNATEADETEHYVGDKPDEPEETYEILF